jgi:quinol monooxygenase YgiN
VRISRKECLKIVPLLAGAAAVRVHTGPLLAQAGASAAEVIGLRSTFRVKAGRQAEFQKVSGQMFEMVRTKEPRTLIYAWYASADGNSIAAVESYADSAAVLTHFNNVGPLVPQLIELVDIQTNAVYGNPTAALMTAVAGFRWFQIVPPDRLRFLGGGIHM